MKEIQDDELRGFCQWFRLHFGKTHTFVSTLVISMADRFHLTVKMAKPLIQRCEEMDLIRVKNKTDVYFLDEKEPDFRPFGLEW